MDKDFDLADSPFEGVSTLATDRYRILGRLGRGGVGQVFAAEVDETGRRVALKLLPEYGSHPAATRERFESEVALCQAVLHPNVCAVLDAGHTASGRPFLALEPLEGETLGERLRRQPPLSVHHLLRLVREAARGLGALHRAGIVHCDVKPDNLFLCDTDVHGVPLKVIDLGFASRSGEAPQDPLRVFGTLRYTPPERVVGDPVDGRGDIYSLGVVLFRALTGEFPFDACSDRQIVGHHLTSSVPPASWLREGVTPEIDAIIECATRKHPENRYPNMAALCEDLDSALAGRPVAGVPWVVVPDLFEPSTDLGRRVADVVSAA